LKNILIVTRYFPPLSSAGASIRLVKIIKYASQQGWSFNVLTQDQDHPVIQELTMSEFLLKEIPVSTIITRVGDPFHNNGILKRIKQKFFHNSSIPWGLAVVSSGWKKYHRSKPDLIFVNSPPFTNVTVGAILSKLFSIPFILDMKDDWVGSPEYYNKGRLRKKIESSIEKSVLQKASAVITPTIQSYEAWTKRYSPHGLENKIRYIPNGEDLDEFKFLFRKKRNLNNQRFRILSSASGYRKEYRDLSPFLKALELFVNNNPNSITQIELEFLGEEPDAYFKHWLRKLLPTSAVHYCGVVDRKELVIRMWQADLFFLVQPYENFSSISGTLYEYWAVGKAPVLLFSETGASSNLVINNFLGKHFNFDQVEEASNYIEQIYNGYLNEKPIWIERSGVEAFDRKKLVNEMIAIWEEIINDDKKV